MSTNLFIGVLIGIILTFFLIEIKNKCIIKDSATELLYKIIQKLVRQASRWSMAAVQDKSPVVQVIHANYGMGFLNVLLDIATEDQIKSATNIDVEKFKEEITKIQQMSTLKLSKLCPKYKIKKNKEYLQNILINNIHNDK